MGSKAEYSLRLLYRSIIIVVVYARGISTRRILAERTRFSYPCE